MTVFGSHKNSRPSNQVSMGNAGVERNAAIDSVGECIVRTNNWDTFLEVCIFSNA